MARRKTVFFVLALLLLLSPLVLTACNRTPASAGSPNKTATTAPTGTPPSQAVPPKSPSSQSATKQVDLTLYFPTPNAAGLAPFRRQANVTDGAVIQAIFAELQNPPSGWPGPLPSGTKLLGASVKNGVATIDLSPEFRSNFKGGSSGELATIYSIVDSLTSLPDVKSVQFLLNGQKQDAILSQLDTTQPLKFSKSVLKS
ncbi:Sporulation and spore germination [Acididesulfobacillus acetoxydans]|uniref:Sporulation and spore germination n=1 Tax=Acididesulfobacillus acetoxydans TaxID=1561005 RepID=A0A8S0Y0U3_9FIRM|nr:GerMN domain-containing protein [Acididesulfobacillus acetoxydans]CAA7603457.1 Sporulation and spore germination [Acididesulfobacillus acetoxydans]CEJ06840.1 Sporulation and spore germination [Acididesulfobacillus acetoxydans]